MSYIVKHWRGELSLAVAFWVNCVLLTAVLVALWGLGISQSFRLRPDFSAALSIGLALALVPVYVWQLLGVFRAARKQKIRTDRKFLPSVFQLIASFLLVFNLLSFRTIDFAFALPMALVFFGVLQDPMGPTTLTMRDDTRAIVVEGGLTVGVSGRVGRLIRLYPNTDEIILNSSGGWLYEGRALARLIQAHGLKTRTFTECASACTMAFIAGQQRLMGPDAGLGFHAYAMLGYGNPLAEQDRDALFFLSQSVDPAFVDRMFEAPNKDMWYPSHEELLQAGILHGFVDPETLGVLGAVEALDISGSSPMPELQ